MNAKHTPGPWRAVDGRYTGVGISFMQDGKYQQPLCVSAIYSNHLEPDLLERCVAVVNGKSTGEVDADCNLIAAAPELLDALREAIGCIEILADACSDRVRNVDVEKFYKIVAKATGA